MLAPDCGMKYLPRASAEGKLRAMAGQPTCCAPSSAPDRSGRRMADTIPGLLAAAAARDPDGVWLRTDDGS